MSVKICYWLLILSNEFQKGRNHSNSGGESLVAADNLARAKGTPTWLIVEECLTWVLSRSPPLAKISDIDERSESIFHHEH
jgi:hypothetical protein